MHIYPYGLDELRNWQTVAFRWRMVKSGSFDPSATFMNLVITGGNEISVVGYSPLVVTTKLRTVSVGDLTIYYTCDAPNFGALATGQTVTAIVLERRVTSDADSIPIGWQDITPVDTAAINPFLFNLPGGIAAQTLEFVP